MSRAPLSPCIAVLVGAALVASACSRPLLPGDPVRGLTREERTRFERGRAVFDSVFTAANGLGPLFNAPSCGECHEAPVPGGSGDEVEEHATASGADGACDPLVEFGGFVFQQHATPALTAALGIDREPLPAQATTVGHRTTPVLFGRGLLDAVPDSVILAYADPDDRNHDGISGRANRFFDGRLGRFGRKALVPTLREFNDGAFVIEMGVTNPAVPTEETVGGRPLPAGVDPAPDPELTEEAAELADTFVRLLAPPTPLKASRAARRGRGLFSRIGCSACHMPTLVTGEAPIAALRHKKVAAYTDLLLHDLGPTLGDICLGLATPTEFRTEPLLGLRSAQSFLHDGRAATPEAAIELHGGEATAARDRFTALSAYDRAALIAFLRTL
jgi:CxxC motif-containing protein (DUF1111 family)